MLGIVFHKLLTSLSGVETWVKLHKLSWTNEAIASKIYTSTFEHPQKVHRVHDTQGAAGLLKIAQIRFPTMWNGNLFLENSPATKILNPQQPVQIMENFEGINQTA